MYGFIAHIGLIIFPMITSIAGFSATAEVRWCQLVIQMSWFPNVIVILCKIAFWWTMLYYRVYEPGRVCSGRMADDCSA